MNNPFHIGGAISDDFKNCYITRVVDDEICNAVERMDYILIVEPRQQGKTSLVNSLIRKQSVKVTYAYVDVTTLDQSTIGKFYSSLISRINAAVKITTSPEGEDCYTHNYIRGYLKMLASKSSDSDEKLVIILDEIGAVRVDGSAEFFSVLRDLYNSRQVEPELKCLTFILVGAFHPRDLITDNRVSPFNVARRLRLPDFTLTQVEALVNLGWKRDVKSTELATEIFSWTQGQPYMTQYICANLYSDSSGGDVSKMVDKFRKEDNNHLPHIIRSLESDPSIVKYLQAIINGKKIHFYPGENRKQAQLELLGLIKEDINGKCSLRNPIYSLALKGFLQEHQNSPQQSLSQDGQRNSMPSRNKLVFGIIAAGILTFTIGFLTNLVSGYVAPSLIQYSKLIYISLGFLFVISIIVSIYLNKTK